MVCAIFPKDGITIGNVHFEFPTLDEILTVETHVNTATPDELLAQQLKATSTTDDVEFKKFTESNPARFHMPAGDITYFDDLFEAMENSSAEPMRVLHYGDSQLEEDRISSELRERLQTAFGGTGVGMVPAIQAVAKEILKELKNASE